MPKDKTDSRKQMVMGAADMIRRRGLNATSVRELAKHASAPLGSTYHYFPGGKYELATEAVRWADDITARTSGGANESRFRVSDLEELAKLCHDLTERGVIWVMSNRDTQQVRDLFPENEIVRFTARRSVAAQNRRDIEATASPEALILGGPHA